MNKIARRTPIALVIALALLLFLCMTGTILYATMSATKSQTGKQIGVVGTLKAEVSTNTITVTNDMECVMRATPLSSGITFGSNWVLQDNGWYYYGQVLSKASSGQAITLTGATSSNLAVELAQAQYLTDKDASGNVTGVKSGFVTEWASRDVNSTTNSTLGTYTTDGLKITKSSSNNTIVMYSGHDEDRRVPSGAYSADNTQNRFKATRNSSGYYVFNQINLGSGTTFETITSTNAITLYNNSKISVVYMFQVINSGHQPTKNSTFSNGNWTTYIDTTPSGSSHTFVKADGSTATDYSTYFISKVVAPGEYVDVTNGSDNLLDFGSSLTESETAIRLSVSSIDTMTFYYKYMNTPTADNYLNWLNKLGGSYYNDFVKIFE